MAGAAASEHVPPTLDFSASTAGDRTTSGLGGGMPITGDNVRFVAIAGLAILVLGIALKSINRVDRRRFDGWR